MGDHSKYSPSSAFRWTVCNASLDFIELSETNEFAKEGNRAHQVTFEKEAFFKCNDRVMRFGAMFFHDYVNNILGKDNYKIHYEQKVYHGVIKELYGTADCIAYNEKELHIFDYKYGFRKVSAIDNTQLITYAICSFYTFKLKVENITLHIIQPRIKHTEFHKVGKKYLYTYDKIIRASILAKEKKYNPGEAQCKFCPGFILKKCPVYIEK